MVEIYDDHEQSERVRQWVKENGAAIVMGIVLAIGGLYGWKFWQNQTKDAQMQVAAEFQGLATALDLSRFDQAYGHFETIKTDYPNSTYNPMAHLMIARARLNQGQVDLAESLYRELLKSNDESSQFIKFIAAERLARLLLSEGKTDKAKELLDTYSGNEPFAARFAEVRGDLLAASGDADGARAAYQKALDSMEAGTGDRRLLELKRDNPIAIDRNTEES
ncbi:MAG: tetratricopeptide repeat protein [Proteobacteria bacterium]|nr:tetratricopeptide repeat protein [Pseudomonadota bacterium]